MPNYRVNLVRSQAYEMVVKAKTPLEAVEIMKSHVEVGSFAAQRAMGAPGETVRYPEVTRAKADVDGPASYAP